MSSLLKYQNYGRLWKVYGRSMLRYGSPRKVWNALRTEWAYRRRTVDVKSYPYILFLEPLYYCNLDCPLCDRQVFPDARRGDAGKLSLELFDRLLDEAGRYLLQCQIFGQGEPLLDWPRTAHIIRRCHERRIFTLLSTNCTLVTAEIADDACRSGLDHLVRAIDGITQESYEKYRVSGRIEDASNGLRQFVDARKRLGSKMVIEWQFLVHRDNEHEVERAAEMARELGVYIRFSPLRGMEFDRALQAEWLPKAGGEERWQAGRMENGQTVYDWPCYFLWRSLVLNSNGKVARCLVYQNVVQYGDLATASVHELYNHASVRRARELFRKGPVAAGEFPAPCATCSFFGRHHGGANQDKPTSLGMREVKAAPVAMSVAAGAFVSRDDLRIGGRPLAGAREG